MDDARAIPWERFSHDPRAAAHTQLRASDADRDVALDVLAGSFADGRVDREEYDERAATLQLAKTLGDLVPPIRDLAPDGVPVGAVVPATDEAALQARAEDTYAQIRSGAFATFLGPSLVCWVIWAVLGFGFPWPLFVSLGTFVRIARVLMTKRQIIDEQKQEIRRAEPAAPGADPA